MLRCLRGFAIAVVALCAFNVGAQDKDLWRNFKVESLWAKTQSTNLKRNQIMAIGKILKSLPEEDGWCENDDHDSSLRGLTFDEVPLKNGVRIVRATAGAGCARGGQGSNGGMWLFQIEGDKVSFVGAFGGWGIAVLPTESNGFHDFVGAWHLSSIEHGLSYYRFDGKVYKEIDQAFAVTNDEQTAWCVCPNDPANEFNKCLQQTERVISDAGKGN